MDANASTVKVERTLVKSRPEVRELVSDDPRLSADGVEVSLADKGFGTRVEISADVDAGLAAAELETILDQLAEPQRRPFSAS